MRIDKFLWSVRVYKTRAVASEEIKKNRVSVAGQVVKSSREVKVNDLITIRKNQIDYKIQVIAIPKSRVGAKLVSDYIADKTDKLQYEILELRRAEQNYYRQKGEGRPTKKDRRELSEYTGAHTSDATTDWDALFSGGLADDDDDEGADG